MSSLSRGELQRFHAGDEQLFRRLVDELSPRLLAVTRSFSRDLDEAHDLLQETWQRAYTKRGSFRGEGSILAWLAGGDDGGLGQMSDCFDLDDLVTLNATLGWMPKERLRHLSECEVCRLKLEEIGALHEALDAAIEPRPGFTDRVVRSLTGEAAGRTTREAVGRRPSWLVRFVNPTLAGLTAFFALALAAGSSGSPGPGLPTLLASALVAAITLWWDQRRGAIAEATR